MNSLVIWNIGHYGVQEANTIQFLQGNLDRYRIIAVIMYQQLLYPLMKILYDNVCAYNAKMTT